MDSHCQASEDSGCGSDLTDSASDQISSSANHEYNFILSLLKHVPGYGIGLPKNDAKEEESFNLSISNIGKQQEQQKSSLIKALPQKSEDSNSTPHISNLKNKLEAEIGKLRRGKGGFSKQESKHLRKKLVSKLKSLDKLSIKTKKRKEKEKFNKRKNGVKEETSNTTVKEVKKIYSNCGKLVFSKFDFSDSVKDKWTEKRKPDLKNVLSSVLKEKEKVKKFNYAGDAEKAASTLEKISYNNAFKKMQGEKVKDNTEIISKSMRKLQQKKQKSQKKWEERQQQVKKAQDQRQDKRNQNIEKKKQQKHSKLKGKNQKKKNSKVPGF